jgi:glycosyltransferase involved in cell wall biosynthesis
LYFPWGLDDLGGAQISVGLLADALVHRGYRVGVVEMASARSLDFACRFSGPLWTVPVLYPPRRAWSWRGVVASARHLQRIIGMFRPDIVSVHSPARQSPSVVAAHLLPHRWRLVVTARAESEIRAETAGDRWLRRWIRRLLKRADVITAVSEALRRDLIALHPFVRDRTCTIPNGLDGAWFTAPLPRAGEARYILYVGRLEVTKGVDVLLEAWRQVQEHAAGCVLWVAGDGSEREHLRMLAERLGVTSRVLFLGRVAPQCLPTLYAGADLVVLPSRSRTEGLPRVLLEAGAAGAICVATRVGGVPEVIDDRITGFVADADSPRALAEALRHALQLSPVERDAMRTAARTRIGERFSHERTADVYEAVFGSLLASR